LRRKCKTRSKKKRFLKPWQDESFIETPKNRLRLSLFPFWNYPSLHTCAEYAKTSEWTLAILTWWVTPLPMHISSNAHFSHSKSFPRWVLVPNQSQQKGAQKTRWLPNTSQLTPT
jgi:hypothetical protein